VELFLSEIEKKIESKETFILVPDNDVDRCNIIICQIKHDVCWWCYIWKHDSDWLTRLNSLIF